MKKLLIVLIILSLLTGVGCDLDDTPDGNMVNLIRDGGGGGSYNLRGLQPYFDEKNIVMLPMTQFNKVFEGSIKYKTDGNNITFTKKVLDVITIVSVTVDSNILIKNEQEIIMEAVPISKNNTIYIPLVCVADALGCWVSRFQDTDMVYFYTYTSAYIYIWNENENSSPEGIRYSYTIGDFTEDFDIIKINATSDYNEVHKVIKKLPRKANVSTVAFYGIRGHKVPYDIQDDIVYKVSDLGYGSSYGRVCIDEVPPIIAGFDKFSNEYISEELYALHEDAIYNSPGHIYRFIFYPAFTNPVILRFEIAADGAADAHYKLGDGQVWYGDGGIAKSEVVSFNEYETDKILGLLDSASFWSMDTKIDYMGLDGYSFIIEGVKDGEYHIIERWEPKNGDPIVYGIEKYFWELIENKFP